MKKKTRQVHRGLSLIEAGIVLMLLMLMATAASVYWKNSTDNLEYNATAVQLNTINSAAINYIHDNYATISQNVSAGKPYYITGQQLRDAGYLVSGYSLTNNSDQEYQVAVAVNPAFSSKLVAFVLTQNGSAIPYSGLRSITAFAGGMAGYVKTDNQAEGAYGGWKVSLADYGLSARAGHLAAYISSDRLGGSADAGDRLYRYSVDGHPDLNQMQTSIDMNHNNITNGGTLSAADINASDTVNTNILTASGSVTASGAVTGGTVRATGRLSTGEVLQLDQVNTAGASCSPNGLISRDSNGGMLSCLSGIWTSPGNGWKQPSPQTISCNIKYSGSGYNYTDTFQAKIDSDGTFWTQYLKDSGSSTGWVKGEYVGSSTSSAGYNVVAKVTVSGLEGTEPITTCRTVSHDEQQCGDAVPHYCYATWTY